MPSEISVIEIQRVALILATRAGLVENMEGKEVSDEEVRRAADNFMDLARQCIADVRAGAN